ncbi:MAG: hypothetical protein ABIR06_01925 [Cyclobacteriaceae bacterium]
MKKCIVFLAMMMAGSTIFAQQKSQRSGFSEKQSEKMKTELSLNDEQGAKIDEINKKFASRQSILLADTVKSRENKLVERKKIQEERNAQIKSVLTKEQFAQWTTNKEKHLKESQSKGRRAGGVRNEMDELKTELNLSDDQYKKMLGINSRMSSRMRSVRSDSTVSRQNSRQEMQKLKAEKNAAVKEILSEDQYKKFLAYEDEKFSKRRRVEMRNHEKPKKG